MTSDQFLDFAILAGFDYCSTFPPLVDHGTAFSLENLADLLRQFHSGAAIVQHYATHPQVIKINYSEIFFRTRCAITNHLILDDECVISPINIDDCASDLHEIFGAPLPNTIYFFTCMIAISPQVLNSLLSGVIIEGPPLCNGDTVEYRSMLKSLVPVRTQIISLLSHRLSNFFRNKKVSTYYWFESGTEHIMQHTDSSSYPNDIMKVSIPPKFLELVHSTIKVR